MKITIIVEGKTERAFKPYLGEFLKERFEKERLEKAMPRLDFFHCDGRIPKKDELRRKVEALLTQRVSPPDAVIALTDVYTGADDFKDAADTRQKMRAWVGNEPRFYPHAAQHDFEAWLLPYWSTVQRIAGHNRSAPSGSPESVDHNHPPSWHLQDIFRVGKRRKYSKERDARSILRGQDLAKSADACPELKAFLNTVLTLCGGQPLP